MKNDARTQMAVATLVAMAMAACSRNSGGSQEESRRSGDGDGGANVALPAAVAAPPAGRPALPAGTELAGPTWPFWRTSAAAPPEPAPAYEAGHLPAAGSACVAWRQTSGCVATGRREAGNDRACEDALESGWSGYCECAGGAFVGRDCGHPVNNCLTICSQLSLSAPMIVPAPHAPGACSAWRQTGGCRASGPRESSSDKSCDARIESGASGFCECASGVRIGVDCGHPPSSCELACKAGAWRAAE